MNLDPTAERANEPGWTREARKAWEKAEREKKRAAKRAASRAFWGGILAGIWRGLVETWDFAIRNLLLTLAIATSIATAAWEWMNSARGWRDLYPGYDAWTSIGALGAIGLWYLAFRKAREETRKPADKPADQGGRNRVELWGWVIAAAFAYVLCVAGVFVATATNSYQAQEAAKKSKLEYAGLLAKRDALKETLEIYSPDYWDAVIKQQTRQLDSQLQIAKGTYDMADLDTDKACAGKLSFNARRLCVRVNGGIDEFSGEEVAGIRTELERSARGKAKALEDAKDLAGLEARIRDFRVLSGDETSAAMGAMISGIDAAASLGILYLVLSSIFLAASGWSTDWSLEQIELKRRAARLKAGKAA